MPESRFESESRFAHYWSHPVDNFGTVVGENPTPYGILALWAVNGLSIVYWAGTVKQEIFASSKKFKIPPWNYNSIS